MSTKRLTGSCSSMSATTRLRSGDAQKGGRRLLVLALAVAFLSGCGTTTGDGARTPNTQDKSDGFVKEKKSWDSPTL